MHQIGIGSVQVGNDRDLTVIAGPCQLETFDHALEIAKQVKSACDRAGAGFIFKASYDKANRTSVTGVRGPGKSAGLEILDRLRDQLNIPILTDVHRPEDCADVARVADVLQIPAFLSRQTDLLLAAGETGAVVNVKKGQFLSPWDMEHVIAKLESTGNRKIMITERGSSFGYNTLVADMRSLPIMAGFGYPVVMDATHAVQAPGGEGEQSGGQRAFAPVLARAAVSLGIAAIFVETHNDPDSAPSDAKTMVPVSQMPALIDTLMSFDRLAKSNPISI